MTSHPRAFSLTELLVVIVILAVLLAILLPAITSAQRTARVVRCSSNLRQIGQALHSYQSQHQQWPCVKPPYFDETHPGLSPLSMSESEARVVHAPYLPVALAGFIPADSQVYRCPGDTEGAVYERWRTLNGQGTSYIEWWILHGFREQHVQHWDGMVSDFAGASWNGGKIPNPQLHPGPARFNVLKTDGSVETATMHTDVDG